MVVEKNKSTWRWNCSPLAVRLNCMMAEYGYRTEQINFIDRDTIVVDKDTTFKNNICTGLDSDSESKCEQERQKEGGGERVSNRFWTNSAHLPKKLRSRTCWKLEYIVDSFGWIVSNHSRHSGVPRISLYVQYIQINNIYDYTHRHICIVWYKPPAHRFFWLDFTYGWIEAFFPSKNGWRTKPRENARLLPAN